MNPEIFLWTIWFMTAGAIGFIAGAYCMLNFWEPELQPKEGDRA